MYWISDLKDYDESVKYKTVIHEIVSEAHITGVVDYFSENLLIGSVASSPDTDLHTYQVKIRLRADAEYGTKGLSTRGYYHNEGIVGEIASLLSIFYRARFYVVSSTYGSLTKNSISGRNTYSYTRVKVPASVDKNVFGNVERSFVDFSAFLDSIAAIGEQKHLAIINACSLYNRGLKEVGIDSEMFFIRLVSAIESLSKDYVLRKKDDSLNEEKIKEIADNLPEELQKEFYDFVSSRKSMLKFIKFTEHYSKGFFRAGRVNPLVSISKGKLPAILKTIYTARSKYLHEGELMYLSHEIYEDKWDIDSSVGMTIGKRKFKENQKLPYIRFFESLTNYCVKAYIQGQ